MIREKKYDKYFYGIIGGKRKIVLYEQRCNRFGYSMKAPDYIKEVKVI